MTIRFDTTDAQRVKFYTPYHITIYNIYSLHFHFFREILIYKYIPIRQKISTSQCSQQIVDNYASLKSSHLEFLRFLTPEYIIITVHRDGGRYTASVHVIYIGNNLIHVYLLYFDVIVSINYVDLV